MTRQKQHDQVVPRSGNSLTTNHEHHSWPWGPLSPTGLLAGGPRLAILFGLRLVAR